MINLARKDLKEGREVLPLALPGFPVSPEGVGTLGVVHSREPHSHSVRLVRGVGLVVVDSTHRIPTQSSS